MSYAATSDLKDYIDFDSDSSVDDTLIGDILLRAQKAIETYCHRTFEVSSDGATTRYFDAEMDVEDDDNMLFFDEDFCYVASDTTVTNGDGVAVVASDMIWEPRNRSPKYALKLKGVSGLSWQYDTDGDPENAITIVGNWCYSTAAPGDIVQATVRLTAWMYKQRETAADLDRPLLTPSGLTIMPGKMPQDVISLIEPYRKRGLL